ncbi:MAG: toxin-antitoxin system YwqK family antitoxin [Bacteroidota bacterium]
MNHYLKLFSACSLALLLTHCQSNTNTAVPADLTGFTTTSIAGGAGVKATKTDQNGKVLEEGILINSMKNGSWITYYPNKDKVIQTMANYVNNELNGIYLTFSDRGQIQTLTTYANGVYDGNFAKFRFGNIEESATYKNGELDGLYQKYYPSRKIQTEAEYKNGKQDGFYKYYDEQGKVVMEYQYKNGEKVAGGLKE